MKKRFVFSLLTVFLLLTIGFVSGQVPGKYLGFTADRYWSNAGVLSTDAAIQSVGASNSLKLVYSNAVYASLAQASTGTVTLDVVGGTANVLSLADAISFAAVSPTGTAGSLITTGSTWVAFPTAGACGIKVLLENTADTGEFASLRVRGRSNNTTVSGNGGNSVGTTSAGDFSASAQDHEYGNLKAINAVAQPNALNQTVDATNIVTALYGRVDRTGTSVGRTWVGWLDTHQTTKSSAGDYLLRLSHNGTVANDGAITVYNGGRMPVLFNFEDAAGFLTDSDGSHTVASGAIAVKTPAGTKYLVLYN